MESVSKHAKARASGEANRVTGARQFSRRQLLLIVLLEGRPKLGVQRGVLYGQFFDVVDHVRELARRSSANEGGRNFDRLRHGRQQETRARGSGVGGTIMRVKSLLRL